MFTVARCLDKALELEQRAGEDLPQHVGDDYPELARKWRRLACRALVQEARIRAARTPQA